MQGRSASYRKRQLGAGAAASMFLVIGLIFIALFAVKVAPSYIDDAAVANVLSLVSEEEELLATGKKRDIRGAILKRLGINQVRSVTEKDIVIKKTSKEITVSVNYEVRTALLANLSIVTEFSHKFTESISSGK